LQEKNEIIDGLVKSVQEKDALYNDTKIKLSNANTHSEHLEEENKRLGSTVETCWGRISELDEDKVSEKRAERQNLYVTVTLPYLGKQYSWVGVLGGNSKIMNLV
jgi:predicted nuclease with TOPRIM domain